MKNQNDDINDLLMVENKNFVSCSDDKTIKVWEY